MMVVKLIWIWETMNDFLMSLCIARTTLQLAKYIKKLSIERDVAITWGKLSKVSLISRWLNTEDLFKFLQNWYYSFKQLII